jgi:DNA-binding transcriptional ArsR family regulator
MSLPGVSKHLKVLQRAGLVVQGRDAQWRPCRIEPAGLRDVSQWLDPYRDLWESRFDRMAELIAADDEASDTADPGRPARDR